MTDTRFQWGTTFAQAYTNSTDVVWTTNQFVPTVNTAGPRSTFNFTWGTGTAYAFLWYSGVGQLNVGPDQRVVTAELRIAEEEFVDHPDPDALLGERMDNLRQQLEEALGMKLKRDAVWSEWVSPTVGNDVLLRAEWTPRHLTVETWDAWQNLPKLRRVYDQASRSYIEITEAELRQREWRAAREKAISDNRRHVAELRAHIAQRRASELLLGMLDEEQAQEWLNDRAFTIETADGLRCYRIRHGVAGNIMLVRDGDRVARPGQWLRRYCFHAYSPEGSIPVEDHVLAQKLFIESDEAAFLRLANLA